MNILSTGFLFGVILQCSGREPIKARPGSLPFMVNYSSRSRGLCSGTLVSRVAVLSAAICVTDRDTGLVDKRPINVVAGTTYRHPRRGVRIQVIKIVIPRMSDPPKRFYDIQRSAALLLLKHSLPDIMTEVPMRAAHIDYSGEEVLNLQDECIMIGWHFFSKGDKIYPVQKFLLQRNLRSQFMNVAKKHVFCEALQLKFMKALINVGYQGALDKGEDICIRDPDRKAQPCHGMYGGPYYCRGKVVGMLMAPDAQWTNCTGFSNIIHLLSMDHLKDFFGCVKRIFAPEYEMEWEEQKWSLYEDLEFNSYDYVPAMYDKLEHNPDIDSDSDE